MFMMLVSGFQSSFENYMGFLTQEGVTVEVTDIIGLGQANGFVVEEQHKLGGLSVS